MGSFVVSLALQMRDLILAFGGFWWVYRSKSGVVFSRLEGYLCRITPNVGILSRVWRLGGLEAVLRSKRGYIVSLLEQGAHRKTLPNESAGFLCLENQNY